MKFEIKESKKEFEPIEFTVTIESLSELKSWWARLNLCDAFDGGEPEAKGAKLDAYHLWKYLDKKLKE